jgi:hypothetical protein
LTHRNVLQELAPLFRVFSEVGHFTAHLRGQSFEARLTGEGALNYLSHWDPRFSRVFKSRGAYLDMPIGRDIDIIIDNDLDGIVKLALWLEDPENPRWLKSPQANAAELEQRWVDKHARLNFSIRQINDDSVGCKVGDVPVRLYASDGWLNKSRPSCDRLYLDADGNIAKISTSILRDLLRGQLTSSSDPRGLFREVRLAAQYGLELIGALPNKYDIDRTELMRIMGIAPKRGLSILNSLGVYHDIFRHADDYDAIKKHIAPKPSTTLAVMYRHQTPGTIALDLKGLFSESLIDTITDKVKKLQQYQAEWRHLHPTGVDKYLSLPSTAPSFVVTPAQINKATGLRDVRLVDALVQIGIKRHDLRNRKQSLEFAVYISNKVQEGVIDPSTDTSREQLLTALYLSVLPGFTLNHIKDRVTDAYLRRRFV